MQATKVRPLWDTLRPGRVLASAGCLHRCWAPCAPACLTPAPGRDPTVARSRSAARPPCGAPPCSRRRRLARRRRRRASPCRPPRSCRPASSSPRTPPSRRRRRPSARRQAPSRCGAAGAPCKGPRIAAALDSEGLPPPHLHPPCPPLPLFCLCARPQIGGTRTVGSKTTAGTKSVGTKKVGAGAGAAPAPAQRGRPGTSPAQRGGTPRQAPAELCCFALRPGRRHRGVLHVHAKPRW